MHGNAEKDIYIYIYIYIERERERGERERGGEKEREGCPDEDNALCPTVCSDKEINDQQQKKGLTDDEKCIYKECLLHRCIYNNQFM